MQPRRARVSHGGHFPVDTTRASSFLLCVFERFFACISQRLPRRTACTQSPLHHLKMHTAFPAATATATGGLLAPRRPTLHVPAVPHRKTTPGCSIQRAHRRRSHVPAGGLAGVAAGVAASAVANGPDSSWWRFMDDAPARRSSSRSAARPCAAAHLRAPADAPPAAVAAGSGVPVRASLDAAAGWEACPGASVPGTSATMCCSLSARAARSRLRSGANSVCMAVAQE